MRFEWDENKRRENLRKHGFDFADVTEIFSPEAFTILDDRFDYGEIRYITFSLLTDCVVSITHTETDEVIRIIAVRRAEKDEETEYYKQIRN